MLNYDFCRLYSAPNATTGLDVSIWATLCVTEAEGDTLWLKANRFPPRHTCSKENHEITMGKKRLSCGLWGMCAP
jgi:hypothetical protein